MLGLKKKLTFLVLALLPCATLADDPVEDGTEVIRVDGEIHTFYKGTGPKNRKIKSIEIVENGERKFWKLVDYDEAGRLAWEMDQTGFTTVYRRDENGKVVEKKVLPPRDPKTLQALKEKEERLRQEIAEVPRGTTKSDLWLQLGFFYLHEMKDPDKAQAQVPNLTGRGQLYSLKLQVVSYDNRRTNAQKIEGYKLLLAEFPEPEHQEQLEWMIKKTQKNIDAGKE